MFNPSARTRKSSTEDSTEAYGVGAFLLAGSEMYRMAGMKTEPRPPVTNPGHLRHRETVELNCGDWPDGWNCGDEVRRDGRTLV